MIFCLLPECTLLAGDRTYDLLPTYIRKDFLVWQLKFSHPELSRDLLQVTYSSREGRKYGALQGVNVPPLPRQTDDPIPGVRVFGRGFTLGLTPNE